MEPVWLRLWLHGGARGISLSDFNRSACDGNGGRTEQPTSVLHIPADLHCLLLPAWMISAMKYPMAFEPWGCVSAINHFLQNNLFRLESNHVHGANPCHQILCFHRFVDVLSLCHPVRDDLHLFEEIQEMTRRNGKTLFRALSQILHHCYTYFPFFVIQ